MLFACCTVIFLQPLVLLSLIVIGIFTKLVTEISLNFLLPTPWCTSIVQPPEPQKRTPLSRVRASSMLSPFRSIYSVVKGESSGEAL